MCSEMNSSQEVQVVSLFGKTQESDMEVIDQRQSKYTKEFLVTSSVNLSSFLSQKRGFRKQAVIFWFTDDSEECKDITWELGSSCLNTGFEQNRVL